MKSVLKQKTAYGGKDTLFIFEDPELAPKARPGQFVEVRIDSGLEPFLRRPISIFSATGNEYGLLVRNAGKGTEIMSGWKPGHEADVLGPLGHGFEICADDQTVLLIGGGIGAAPLFFLANELTERGEKVKFIFSPQKQQILMKGFEPLKDRIEILYAQNRIHLAELTEEIFGTGNIDRVYTCGPNAMMNTIAQKAKQYHIPTQVSMEEHMGCGFGLCSGCAVKVRLEDGDFEYKKACQDGPVFSGEEVIFE